MKENNIVVDDFRIKLFSGREEIVLKTLKEVRKQGSSDLIEVLFDLYVTTQNTLIKDEIFEVIVDINDQKNAELITDLLKKSKYSRHIKDMLSMCWQTSLDFSDNVLFYADYLFNENIEVCIEAYTIVNECALDGNVAIINRIIDFLKDNIERCTNENKELIHGLIKDLQ